MPYRSYSRYAFANRKRKYPYSSSKRNLRSYSLKRHNAYTNPSFGGTMSNAFYKTSMPTSMKVVMKYVENLSVTTSAITGVTDRLFKINSIFDPDHTGVGHQPQGHDQWATIYQQYHVDKCVIRLSCPLGVGHISITANNSNVAINDPALAAESPHTSTSPVSSNGTALVIVKEFNLADIAGISRRKYADDDLYRAPMTADPAHLIFAHVVPVDNAGGASTFNYQICLTYYCTLYDPVALGLS